MKGASCSSEQVADGLIDRLWFEACDYVWPYVKEVNPEGIAVQRGSMLPDSQDSLRRIP